MREVEDLLIGAELENQVLKVQVSSLIVADLLIITH